MSVAAIINEDQRDCYQELTNVAMGQAADRLARLLNAYVVLPIPKISVIENSDLNMALQGATSDSSMPGLYWRGYLWRGNVDVQ